MEELINKPDNQFKNILNDLIDYSKDSEEKSALIKEVCHAIRPAKPAASLNSSIYSSAASDSSTSSTLSSPSQSTQSNNEASNTRLTNHGHELDNIEVAKMEDLGKTARIIEHRLATSSELKPVTNGVGHGAGSSSHSDKRSLSLNGKSTLPSSSSTLSQMVHHQSNLTNQISASSSIDTNITNWITINKRDKRRKRPAEQPVLSEHIPGHKGGQEVDWLVNFIESGRAGVSNMNNNSNKKITRGTKIQPKRQPNQTMDHDREINSRKTSQKSSSTTQIKPQQQQQQQPQPQLQQPQQQTKPVPSANPAVVHSSQSLHSSQRKVHAILIDNQPQQSQKHQSLQEQPNDCINESKETTTNIKLKAKRNHDQRREGEKQDEAAVTFAEHIRISDDDVSDQYVFGFFDEKRQQTGNQTKPTKTTTKHNENSPVSNTKSNQVGQKHKLKYPKASLNSEQKRYKFNDNIDANSFNYHQILEFIRNSWESTTKSQHL